MVLELSPTPLAPLPATGTELLNRRIEGFVVNFFMNKLKNMSDEEYAALTEELAVEKLEALTSINQVASRCG